MEVCTAVGKVYWYWRLYLLELGAFLPEWEVPGPSFLKG
jgi:hypothetical protein